MYIYKQDLSLRHIERVLEETRQLRNRVDRCKEAVTTLSNEYNYVVQNPSFIK
jgi:hypothetical protein